VSKYYYIVFPSDMLKLNSPDMRQERAFRAIYSVYIYIYIYTSVCTHRPRGFTYTIMAMSANT